MDFDLDDYLNKLSSKLKNSLLKREDERVKVEFQDGYSISSNSFDNSLKERSFNLILGPCSIRDRESTFLMARQLKEKGIVFFRSGCFKPRTSPFSFRGLGKEGLKILAEVKKEFSLITVSEIMDENQLESFKDVDILQLGARNMQNFSLLTALSKQEKPVLLKRGLASSLEEFLLSAEYLAENGKENIILCQRLVKSGESPTGFSYDGISSWIIKKLVKYPLILDPCHGSASASSALSQALSSYIQGLDGIMLEYIDDRASALSDAKTSIDKKELDSLLESLKRLKKAI